DNTTHIYNPLTIKTNEISNLHHKNIVFISRLSLEQKGLDYLVEVARNLSEGWKLHIAGDGPDREWLEEQIVKYNLINKVVIHGRMDPDNIIELYLLSSLFISTSRWEGFGLVLTEAMSVGLPIVAFKNQGPSEILADGKYGVLIEKGNTRKFCEVINGLTSSLEQRTKYQELSLKRVKDFDTKEITQQWDTQFKKINGRND
ncbi:glycosyltransferase, partial [Terribacillus saccharophilus]